MTENGNDIEKYRKEVESKTKELETLNTKYESAQNSLNDANKQIKSYKDMDIEGIKNSAAEWEKKYKDETAELNNKLTQQERDFATNSYFAGMNFTSESAKRGIISQFKEQNFELKDGKFIGADEYINGLKESDAGAFVVEKKKLKMNLHYQHLQKVLLLKEHQVEKTMQMHSVSILQVLEQCQKNNRSGGN